MRNTMGENRVTKLDFIVCPFDDQTFSFRKALKWHLAAAHPKVKVSGVRNFRQSLLQGRSIQRRRAWEAAAVERAEAEA